MNAPQTASCACGNEFEPYSVQHKYCSAKCRSKYKYTIPCSDCGDPRPVSSRQVAVGKPVTCQKCRAKVHGLSNYRQGCRCEVCREAKRLSVKVVIDGRRECSKPGCALPMTAKGLCNNHYTYQHRKDNGAWSDSGWISKKRRYSIYERDDYICHLCNEPVDVTASPFSDLFPSLDHIIPKSKGGSNRDENLKTAHRLCNALRGAEDVMPLEATS